MAAELTQTIPTWALVIVTITSFSICSLLLGLFLKRWINNAYKGWEKYETLKEQVITDWRITYCQKLDSVKDTVEEIKKELDDKVAVIDHDKVALQVDEHGKKIIVLEIEVKNIKRREK